MSYGFSQYVPLTKENILRRVSQEDIFKMIFKESISEGEYYTAPYREDSTPKCYFEYIEGELLFVDFANVKSRFAQLDWINLIQLCYSVNFAGALEIVNQHFQLGLGTSSTSAKPILFDVQEEPNRIIKPKIQRNIFYYPRDFNKKDAMYWSAYGISKQNLIDDKVFPINLFQSTTKEGDFFSVAPYDITYAYTDFKENRVKIYRPLATDSAHKWFTNCNMDDVGSLSSLPLEGEDLLITKSYKDCRVLRNLRYTSIWFQNEGMFPKEETLVDILRRFKRVFILFDNDEPGEVKSLLALKVLTDICTKNGLQTKVLLATLPKNDKDAKDSSDYYKLLGVDILEQSLQKFNIKKFT